MKVYVVYVLSDWATAVFMSTNKKESERKRKFIAKQTGYKAWIAEYDFASQQSFELECD